ncbi:MAG: SDR family oxidoreductase [Oceanospirillaceae bacterium]|nr:SDR family oxidoreductase [Oceanospirillaceae bacterium]
MVTGAGGFVGRNLLETLSGTDGYFCSALSRSAVSIEGVRSLRFDGFEDLNSLDRSLQGQDVVIHCAARAHVMNETETDSLAAYRKINVEGTLNLARAALTAGVKRFIFISSIKVNGESTPEDLVFTASDLPKPEDPYGVSKHEAEVALRRLVEGSSMELVIIRPPLVYGPGVKGNFETLVKLCRKGLPLPFGAINNARSYVAIDNLVSFIIRCIDHPKAADQTFLVSDGNDLSTTALLTAVGQALGARLPLLPVPSTWLISILRLFGKGPIVDRLFGSLRVDITKNFELLGWKPEVSVEEGLYRCVKGYRE